MMEKLLLKNVRLDSGCTNILIENGYFADIAAPGQVPDATVIDCTGKAILPAFYNTHNHAGMMYLRGGGDDLPLQKWLTEYIWPTEDKMGAEDIRRSNELACKEMIKSGSVFFNDMYFEIETAVSEVDKAGIRACIGITIMENHSKSLLAQKLDFIANYKDPTSGRIKLSIAPHSVYTVGPERLRMSAELARKYNLPIHIHVSETLNEVQDCLRDHGMTPVRYLDSLGVLGPDVIAAHCVHVDEEEWDILAERGVTVSHCPCSNMKLASGRFPYELAIKSGVKIALGTDSASSNNNLDMREEMKFAALLAKVNGDPELLPAKQVFEWATVNGAAAFGFKAGKIQKGWLADAVLLDLSNPRLIPNENLYSMWVYAADCSCIDSVICNGRILF